MQDDFASLFAYNRWASDRTLAACRSLAPEAYSQTFPGGMTSIRTTLVHLAGATQAWVRRLEGETITSLPTEDEMPTLDDAARVLDEAHAGFDRILATLTPERLAAVWEYRNLAGQQKRLPIWTVLRHVVNHASYHRGQVATKLKRAGVDPPSTDFVAWAYEQVPQPG